MITPTMFWTYQTRRGGRVTIIGRNPLSEWCYVGNDGNTYNESGQAFDGSDWDLVRVLIQI